MANILIIEDHALFRDGLKSLLQTRSDLRLVGEASDGKEGIRLTEKLKPELVLLDLILPGMHGLQVLRKLQKTTKVLAVSMRIDELFVAEALKSGALGYVVKEDSFTELLQAIQSVQKGQRYLSRKLDAKKISRLLERFGTGEPQETLTAREHEILQMAAEGLTSTQIGNVLSISPRTVEMHRGNLMRKLALRSQADLVRFAIRNHIIAA